MDGGGGTRPEDVTEGGCGTNDPDAVVAPANNCVFFRPEPVSPPKICVDD
jgi:hypothetical protein